MRRSSVMRSVRPWHWLRLWFWRREVEPGLSLWRHLYWCNNRHKGYWWISEQATIRFDWRFPWHAWEASIQVSRQYQGKGYGLAAYRWLANYLDNHPYMKVFGRVANTNIAAQRCLAQTGFYPPIRCIDGYLWYTLQPKSGIIIGPWRS